MYAAMPEEILETCVQMACYLVTMIGAVFSWLVAGRPA